MLTRRRFLTTLALTLGGGVGGFWLRQDKARAPNLLRPPGALPENDFLAACIRCGLCVEACPYHTLKLADATHLTALGTPYLVARVVPCRLCQGYAELKCIAACPTGALRPVKTWREIRMGVAVINRDTCLAWQGTPCRACWHACPFPNEAIVLDERGRALVDETKCIGCGICENACVTEPSSIGVTPRQ
jgi:MauM/NapG family ferredoxin protein